MTYSLVWLPEVLEQAGLKVARVDGWERRGRAEAGVTLGVLCHHTGGSKNGNMPTLNVLVHGRPGLMGPLSQLGLGRDGTYYVIAAGRCNHAGAGRWNGVVDGNGHFIGIEAENTGHADDPWPAVQIDAYQRGVAAILKHARRSADDCAGHKEYALPAGRKADPSFDMPAFRAAVAQLIQGSAPPPALIPPEEPVPASGGGSRRVTLRRGMRGPLVERLQSLLGVRIDGDFGGKTEAAVRMLQRAHGLVPDGIVGPKTWALVDAAAPSGVARTAKVS